MTISPPLLLPLNGQVSITVTRKVGGEYVNGAWVKPSPTNLTIIANIQPITKSTEVALLPEGDRSKEVIKLYTTSQLFQRREGSSPIEGDLISWDGKSFEVLKVVRYQMGVLDHFRAVCVRKEIT